MWKAGEVKMAKAKRRRRKGEKGKKTRRNKIEKREGKEKTQARKDDISKKNASTSGSRFLEKMPANGCLQGCHRIMLLI